MSGSTAASLAAGVRRLAISMLCLLATSPLRGFNYKEHRDVGNEALRRAAAYFTAKCGTSLPVPLRDELEEVHRFATSDSDPPFKPLPITYGDIVASVDYVTEPSELAFQGGLAPGSLRQPGLLFNEHLIRQKPILRFLHATHHDRNHFQDRALITYQTWHRAALQLVRLPADFGGQAPAGSSGFHEMSLALIYSAYADHFLQDFFAPGHIRTPRLGLHDAASMGIHDYFNRQRIGEEFTLTHIDYLEEFFEDRGAFRKLSAARVISLFGDGTLSQHPDQAEFMSAVQARLIADILARRYGCPASSEVSIRAPIRWARYELVPDKDRKGRTRTRTPLAEIPFGQYVRKDLRNANALGWTPIIGAHAGYQSLFSGSRSSGRGKFDFEVIPLGVVGKEWRDGSRWYYPRTQLGLGVDYSYISSRDYSGHGLGLRVYRPVTQIDFQFSGGAALRWYDAKASSEKARKIAYDVKGEFGYGVLFLGIGVGREHHLVEGKGFEPALAFSATVSLGFPPSAIPKLLRKDRGVTFKSAERGKPAPDSRAE